MRWHLVVTRFQNPDLVAHLQRKAELNPQRAESFYGGGAEATLITRRCNPTLRAAQSRRYTKTTF